MEYGYFGKSEASIRFDIPDRPTPAPPNAEALRKRIREILGQAETQEGRVGKLMLLFMAAALPSGGTQPTAQAIPGTEALACKNMMGGKLASLRCKTTGRICCFDGSALPQERGGESTRKGVTGSGDRTREGAGLGIRCGEKKAPPSGQSRFPPSPQGDD